MSEENKDLETLSVRINPDLIRLLNSKTGNKNINESKLLFKCIQTGLHLGEINTIFRKKMIEESAFHKQLIEAYGDRTRSAEHVSKDLERIRESANEDNNRAKESDQDLSSSKKDFKTLKVRVDQDFYQEIKGASDKMGVEVSTFVRFCIRTGLYLEDLNLYLQKLDEEQ